MSSGEVRPPEEIIVYTDGSYDPDKDVGAWGAIILINEKKLTIKEIVKHSTHQRMELLAVINSLEYLINKGFNSNIKVYTDSQYISGLISRFPKLIQSNYLTKAKKELVNNDLLKRFYQLINSTHFELFKVKAHLKKTEIINYNREVDKMVRNLVRNESN